MKFPIEWHETNLRNVRQSLDVRRQEAMRLAHYIARLEANAAQIHVQIEEAKRRGLDAFDPERFMKGAIK